MLFPYEVQNTPPYWLLGRKATLLAKTRTLALYGKLMALRFASVDLASQLVERLAKKSVSYTKAK